MTTKIQQQWWGTDRAATAANDNDNDNDDDKNDHDNDNDENDDDDNKNNNGDDDNDDNNDDNNEDDLSPYCRTIPPSLSLALTSSLPDHRLHLHSLYFPHQPPHKLIIDHRSFQFQISISK